MEIVEFRDSINPIIKFLTRETLSVQGSFTGNKQTLTLGVNPVRVNGKATNGDLCSEYLIYEDTHQRAVDKKGNPVSTVTTLKVPVMEIGDVVNVIYIPHTYVPEGVTVYPNKKNKKIITPDIIVYNKRLRYDDSEVHSRFPHWKYTLGTNMNVSRSRVNMMSNKIDFNASGVSFYMNEGMDYQPLNITIYRFTGIRIGSTVSTVLDRVIKDINPFEFVDFSTSEFHSEDFS